MGLQRDQWAEWLLRRRFGGDPEGEPDWIVNLTSVRDRVLDNARLEPGETLLDVGAGDGLIAFGALERGAGRVLLSDISDDLLEHSRGLAEQTEVADRACFLRASADDLSPVADASVDVVTTRSVLIYVEDKRSAFREFFRVLRPGGRLSLFEPINRFGSCYRTEHTFWGYPLDGLKEVAAKVNALYESVQPASDPMLDFDERDLITLAEGVGFFPVELDLHAQITPLEPRPWQRFVNSAGNPKIPTLAEAMDETLTLAERRRLIAHLRPLVEGGRGVWRMAKAFLWAERPEQGSASGSWGSSSC
jgi:arsenite methyltransferase